MTGKSAPWLPPQRPNEHGVASDTAVTSPSRLSVAFGSALRIAPWVMFGIVGLLIVWTTVLDSTLHGRALVRNWSTTWIGLDLAEAVMLALTAFLLLRRSRMLSPAAAATAALVVLDAWFDVMTSANGSGSYASLLSAVFIEIPAALALGALSLWSIRSTYFEDSRSPDNQSAINGEQVSR